jgi:hypothetical protein
MSKKLRTTRKSKVFGRASKQSTQRNRNLSQSRKSIKIGRVPEVEDVRLNPVEAGILAQIEAKHDEPGSMKRAVNNINNIDAPTKQRIRDRIDWLFPERNFRHFKGN